MNKKDDLTWRLLMTIPAGILMFIGLAVLANGGSDRGTPSRIALMSPGCELVRMAGAKIDLVRGDGTCVVRGFVRQRVFSSDILIDLGAGIVLDISGHQVAGHVPDESFDAPLGSSQLQTRWIGVGVLVAVAGLLALAFWPFRRNTHTSRSNSDGAGNGGSSS